MPEKSDGRMDYRKKDKRMRRIMAWIVGCICLWTTAYAERIMIVSDLHLSEPFTERAREWSALAEKAQDCDAILFLGDNTDNGKVNEHEYFLQCIDSLEKQTGVSVFVIPGNHDIGMHYSREDYERDYWDWGNAQAFARDTDSASCAVMLSESLCLLLLDSTRSDKGSSRSLPYGGFSETTEMWLKQVLQSLSEDMRILACGHHPILSSGRVNQTTGADRIVQILRDGHVIAYLCGHEHGFGTVKGHALREIVVGQIQAYPCCCGVVQVTEDIVLWTTEALFDPQSTVYQERKKAALDLAYRMAEGTLKGTVHEGDQEAIGWFSEVFMASSEDRLTADFCQDMLNKDACRKWREIETRTVVRDWVLGLLKTPGESVRQILLWKKTL